jgi:hypothetical protein
LTYDQCIYKLKAFVTLTDIQHNLQHVNIACIYYIIVKYHQTTTQQIGPCRNYGHLLKVQNICHLFIEKNGQYTDHFSNPALRPVFSQTIQYNKN